MPLYTPASAAAAVSGSGMQLLRTTRLTSSGTWTPTGDAKLYYIEVVGGGGGGGAGARGTNAAARSGGGGGAGGAITYLWVSASDVAASCGYTIGGGDPGKPGLTADGNGAGANFGGVTSITLNTGWTVAASGGFGGTGGGTTAAAGGSARAGNSATAMYPSQPGQQANVGGSTSISGVAGTTGAGGGGGGGGLAATTQVSNGGSSGTVATRFCYNITNQSASNAGAAASNGTQPADRTIEPLTGSGGGGGGSNASGPGGNGANGAWPGGGGGGGGASASGFTSGSGGNGASGGIRIWEFG